MLTAFTEKANVRMSSVQEQDCMFTDLYSLCGEIALPGEDYSRLELAHSLLRKFARNCNL